MLSDIHAEFQILIGRYLGLLPKICCCCCCYCLVLLHFLNNSCRWREWLIGCITIFIQMVNLGLSGEGRSQSFLLLPRLHDPTRVSSHTAAVSSFLLSWVVDNICGDNRSRGTNTSVLPVFIIAPTGLENGDRTLHLLCSCVVRDAWCLVHDACCKL